MAKTDWIGGRVDPELKEEVEAYVGDSDLSIGQLLRRALKEYMKAHPLTEEE